VDQVEEGRLEGTDCVVGQICCFNIPWRQHYYSLLPTVHDVVSIIVLKLTA
jgi:hypothetical protein